MKEKETWEDSFDLKFKATMRNGLTRFEILGIKTYFASIIDAKDKGCGTRFFGENEIDRFIKFNKLVDLLDKKFKKLEK